MAKATIRDDTTTYTIPYERVEEQPIINANTAITIGGIVNSQEDSERLKIITVWRIPQSDMSTINSIFKNYSESLRYKPSRVLWDRTVIEEIQIVRTRAPRIEERVYNGAPYFYLRNEFEEVIET